jgi:hypothetical protein
MSSSRQRNITTVRFLRDCQEFRVAAGFITPA